MATWFKDEQMVAWKLGPDVLFTATVGPIPGVSIPQVLQQH